MRKGQGNILLQDAAEGSADLKKSQQQGGLVFTETRPREYAFKMLPDARAWATDWMDRNGVPAKDRGQVMKHLLGAIGKAVYGRRKVK